LGKNTIALLMHPPASPNNLTWHLRRNNLSCQCTAFNNKVARTLVPHFVKRLTAKARKKISRQYLFSKCSSLGIHNTDEKHQRSKLKKQ